MSAMDLEELRDRLLAGRDMTGWWPAETPFEVMVGAVLTQQTSWENVTKAIAALRKEGLLDVHVVGRLPARTAHAPSPMHRVLPSEVDAS